MCCIRVVSAVVTDMAVDIRLVQGMLRRTSAEAFATALPLDWQCATVARGRDVRRCPGDPSAGWFNSLNSTYRL